MQRRSRQTLVGVWVLLVAVLAATTAWGAVSYDVKPGDWQYQELDKLGQAGLLAGHPQAPISTWTESAVSL